MIIIVTQLRLELFKNKIRPVKNKITLEVFTLSRSNNFNILLCYNLLIMPINFERWYIGIGTVLTGCTYVCLGV